MSRSIIGLAGPAGSGKDTAAEFLELWGYYRYAFAGPLKKALAVLGIEEPEREFKEQPLPGRTYSFRQAAQTLGTEWGRALDPNFWLNLATHKTQNRTAVVISDVRFPNEVEWVRAQGGAIWHIKGRKTDLGEASKHASEVSLVVDVMAGDKIIDNSGSLQDFHRTLLEAVKGK